MKHDRKYAEESDSTSPHKKPFIVDAPATMLKRHTQLSRNARLLYGTLRALADGKTGHLKIRGRWLPATVFDRQAEMCRSVRLLAMRELIACGLVTRERERVERFLNGRRRVVLGQCHYTVYRQPIPSKNTKKPTVLQQSILSTVEETDWQLFPNSPSGAFRSIGVVESGFTSEPLKSNHQKHHRADDDFSVPTSKSSKLETARTILLSKGHDPKLVGIALARVSDLADAKKRIPRSAEYFVTSVERALSEPEERAAIETILAARAEVGVAPDAPLDPSEKHPASKIVMLHQVVEEAARLGRPAREVMAERLASEQGQKTNRAEPTVGGG